MQTVSLSGPWRVTHGFHRDQSLLGLLETLPDGAVDYFDSVDMEPAVIVVVEVAPEKDHDDPAPATSFCTEFHHQNGTRVRKEWQPAKGKTGKRYLAVFGLPGGIVRGETRVQSGAMAAEVPTRPWWKFW